MNGLEVMLSKKMLVVIKQRVNELHEKNCRVESRQLTDELALFIQLLAKYGYKKA